eukprot:m.118746 g.118746  ORF g.118746 m.118746 type:complete len:262 (+) comp19520_c0_seq3:502-1287(+)
MAAGSRLARMKKELFSLTRDPPPGISCWAVGDSVDKLEAKIVGPAGTAFAGGIFRLEIVVPDRFPLLPPQARFITKVYHPNIDTAGRICLEVLKMPPAGAWKPSLSISAVLTSIQLLMAEPNPDDGLMADISAEFQQNRPQFLATAKAWTAKYARDDVADSAPEEDGGPPPLQTEQALPLAPAPSLLTTAAVGRHDVQKKSAAAATGATASAVGAAAKAPSAEPDSSSSSEDDDDDGGDDTENASKKGGETVSAAKRTRAF